MARMPCQSTYREQLVEAIRKFFPPSCFSRWSQHGNGKWTAQKLFWGAVLMSFDEAVCLNQRFENARSLLKVLFPRWKLGQTYSGFLAALRRQTPEMIEEVKQRLRTAGQELAEHQRVHGWLLFAVDGSRFECPRTVANEASLGCAGKEKSSPQIFQTTLQHVGTGLPWDFRLGPGTDSERRHLDEMLSGLPLRSLLTADAGFISYELCCWLITNNRPFLLRVGGNMTLLTKLGFDCEVKGNVVYLWPEKYRDKPPIVLRLIEVRDDGKQPVYLVTNLLDSQMFSDETAGAIYRARWGVEVYYRTIKQTLQRSRLLSRTPDSALVEQTWTVLGAWLLHLMTAEELTASAKSPRYWSPAKARNAVRKVMRHAFSERCSPPGASLREQMRRAVVDSYRRRTAKRTRPWPAKKQDKPPGPPKIREARSKERQRAQMFNEPILSKL